ncbi:ATP-binding cassette domain-containing protein, partial [Campylobacter jejuni]
MSSIFLYLKSSISKVLSILGGSGSGKSTLLRIIAKLEQASSYDLFSCK